MKELQDIAQRLLPLLKAKSKAEKDMKKLKTEIDVLLEEADQVMNVDSYVTEQLTLYRSTKYEVEELTPADEYKIIEKKWDMNSIKALVSLFREDAVDLGPIRVIKKPKLSVRFKG